MAKKASDVSVIHEKISDYSKILKANGIKVWRTYLYGSCVRGRETADSDIDLAVFLEKDEIDGFEDDALLMKLRRSVDLRIGPHTFVKTDFDVTNPFIREIIETGQLIA